MFMKQIIYTQTDRPHTYIYPVTLNEADLLTHMLTNHLNSGPKMRVHV